MIYLGDLRVRVSIGFLILGIILKCLVLAFVKSLSVIGLIPSLCFVRWCTYICGLFVIYVCFGVINGDDRNNL